MDLENEQGNKKKWILIGIGVLILIAIIIFAFLRFGKDSAIVEQLGNVLPFGELGDDTGRPITGTGDQNEANPDLVTPSGVTRPMFLELAKGPVAGATTVKRDGKTFVRYVLRENGFIYDVDPETGVSKQLTNTTIPRVYEASFGVEGNSVVLRYLKRDELTRLDVVKTYLANLELPINADASNAIGTLRGEFLPDNISAVSISPLGVELFYLLPIPEGVSGTVVSLINARPPKEVFRNSFSEWLPQLLNDGTVLLTTKPSAKVPGFAYLYDPKDKSFARLIREKNGLTTQSDPAGKLFSYSENIVDTPTFNLYSRTGFSSEEGGTEYEIIIPLTTLPEKCAWSNTRKALFCGSFSSVGQQMIPDDWYQGISKYKDTFWTVNTETEEISLIADPKEAIDRDFDIISPFTDEKDVYLFFTDKNDSSLWSMMIPKAVDVIEEPTTQPIDTENLSPEELKDAIGTNAN